MNSTSYTHSPPPSPGDSPIARQINAAIQEHRRQHEERQARRNNPNTLAGSLWLGIKAWAALHPGQTVVLLWWLLKKGAAWLQAALRTTLLKTA